MKVLIVLVHFFLYSTCANTGVDSVNFKGTLKKQGITTYQYGTHVISDGKKTYALTSKTINLDPYQEKTVTIVGIKVPGYPIEGGPEYLEVTAVQP